MNLGQDAAVTTALVSSSSAVAVALITAIGVVVSGILTRRKSPTETRLADAADARAEDDHRLEGVRADADSARQGQASALALLESARQHYVTLLEATERRAADLQTTIDSLIEVNRELTSSIRVLQSAPSVHVELVESLREQIRHAADALSRDRAALAAADAEVVQLRARVAELDVERRAYVAPDLRDVAGDDALDA